MWWAWLLRRMRSSIAPPRNVSRKPVARSPRRAQLRRRPPRLRRNRGRLGKRRSNPVSERCVLARRVALTRGCEPRAGEPDTQSGDCDAQTALRLASAHVHRRGVRDRDRPAIPGAGARAVRGARLCRRRSDRARNAVRLLVERADRRGDRRACRGHAHGNVRAFPHRRRLAQGGVRVRFAAAQTLRRIGANSRSRRSIRTSASGRLVLRRRSPHTTARTQWERSDSRF